MDLSDHSPVSENNRSKKFAIFASPFPTSRAGLGRFLLVWGPPVRTMSVDDVRTPHIFGKLTKRNRNKIDQGNEQTYLG